jgi:ubiquinone/menaquinone biosynthesis C-methylase UbiE
LTTSTRQAVPRSLPPWLATLPAQDGFVCISEARRFAHDEARYDEQYASDPANMKVGLGLVEMLRLQGANTAWPALEVGCGTGLLSLGLAAHSPYPWTILTDPSPAFLGITRAKIEKAGIDPASLCFAVLKGEEVDRLPDAGLSLIVLRSTLHHILDVDAFIAQSARALVPGGVLTFEEPCLEGYVLMGAVLQFLTVAAKAAGRPLTADQERTVEFFARTMAFYARTDLDKTNAEDKHLFRVDRLMKAGERCGLTVEFHANRAYESFEPGAAAPAPLSFLQFMRNYAKYCMSWDEALMAVFDEHMPRFCRFVDEASMGTAGPYLHGVFVCRKQS